MTVPHQPQEAEFQRRWADRLQIDTPVLVVRERCAWLTRMNDVSTAGCRLQRPQLGALGVDDAVLIYPLLDQAHPIEPLEGRVARVEPDQLGIAFQDHADPRRFAG